MTSLWKPDARAVIMVSEWPRNAGRVVLLCESYEDKGLSVQPVMGKSGWFVKCEAGKILDAWQTWDTGNGRLLCEGKQIESQCIGIDQWKLRLLPEDAIVETDAATGAHYAKFMDEE
jgi:hypothetical protein